MARSTADQGIAEHRRHRVAHHRLRGRSEREIAAALKREGLRNPETEEPWTHVTVHRDLDALSRTWQRDALGDTAPLKAHLWAELREVRRAAWSKGELLIVLKALKQEAELLGLDAPQKVDIRADVLLIAEQLGIEESQAVAIAEQVLREARR